MRLEFDHRMEVLKWLKTHGFDHMKEGISYEVRWNKRLQCWTIRQTNKVEVGIV